MIGAHAIYERTLFGVASTAHGLKAARGFPRDTSFRDKLVR
jgi:hypothetical protein